jgi:hypothetical protein
VAENILAIHKKIFQVMDLFSPKSEPIERSESPPKLNAEEFGEAPPPVLSGSNKRRSYTAEKKLEILNFAKKYTVHRASEEYGVDRSCIRSWRTNESLLKMAVYR